MKLDAGDSAAELAAVGSKLLRRGKTKDALMKLLKVHPQQYVMFLYPMHVGISI